MRQPPELPLSRTENPPMTPAELAAWKAWLSDYFVNSHRMRHLGPSHCERLILEIERLMFAPAGESREA